MGKNNQVLKKTCKGLHPTFSNHLANIFKKQQAHTVNFSRLNQVPNFNAGCSAGSPHSTWYVLALSADPAPVDWALFNQCCNCVHLLMWKQSCPSGITKKVNTSGITSRNRSNYTTIEYIYKSNTIDYKLHTYNIAL